MGCGKDLAEGEKVLIIKEPKSKQINQLLKE